MNATRICSVHECPKPLRSRGLCSAHYEARRVAHAPICIVRGCGGRSSTRELCPMHYQRWRQFGTVDARPSQTRSDRFWEHVTAVGECWLYSPAQADGYGRVDGALAHRFAYEDMVSEIPTGLVIDHLCMQKACVNPDHLDPVPQRVNVRRAASYYSRLE